MEYKIITNQYKSYGFDFTKEVIEYLQNGWMVAGNVSVVFNPANKLLYFQAIIRTPQDAEKAKNDQTIRDLYNKTDWEKPPIED